jgi:hypothetical protein
MNHHKYLTLSINEVKHFTFRKRNEICASIYYINKLEGGITLNENEKK